MMETGYDQRGGCVSIVSYDVQEMSKSSGPCGRFLRLNDGHGKESVNVVKDDVIPDIPGERRDST